MVVPSWRALRNGAPLRREPEHPLRRSNYSTVRLRRSDPTDDPIRSAIGSSRRAVAGAGVRWLVGARAASFCAGFEVARSGRLSADCGGAVGLATKGARCEPDCRKTALTMMMRLAAAAPMIATESTGRRASLPHTRPASIAMVPTNTAPRPAPRFGRPRLRTIRSSNVRRQLRIADSAEMARPARQRIQRQRGLFPINKVPCRRAAAHDPMHVQLRRRAPLFSAMDRVRWRLNEP
jgi:hypothetical protein